MKARIVSKNTMSVNLCGMLWDVTPLANNWHMTVLYNGNETRPQDITTAFDFFMYKQYARVEHCTFHNVSFGDLVGMLKETALFCKKNGVSFLQFKSKLPGSVQYASTVGNLFEYFSFYPTSGLYFTQCTGERIDTLLHGNLKDVRLSEFDEISDLFIKFREEGKSHFGYFQEDFLVEDWRRKGYLVLTDNGTSIGFLAFSTNSQIRETNIYTLYVTPEYRGKGLGVCLMNYAMCLLGWGNYYIATSPFFKKSSSLLNLLKLIPLRVTYTVKVDDLLNKCDNAYADMNTEEV